MTTEIPDLGPEVPEQVGSIAWQRTWLELLALPSTFVAVFAAIFLVITVSLLDAADQLERRDRAIARSLLVQKLLLDMETGARRYLVSGRPELLHPYQEADASIDGALQGLGESLATDAAQSRRFADVCRLARQWRLETAAMIAWPRVGRDDGRLDRDTLGARGKVLMDRVRDRLAVCLALEEAHRHRQWRSARSTARRGLIGAGMAAILLSGFLAVVARRRMRQLSALRKTEHELRASEERYALAVQGSSAGLWDWTGPQGDMYYSPRLKELLGYEDSELENTLENFTSRLHPEDSDRVKARIREHHANRAPYDVEYRLRTKGGDYRWFHARGQAIWDERGKPTRMAGSITDITPRKQAEEEIRTLNARLERRLQRLASLRKIDLAITTGLDLGTTLGIVLDQVSTQLHVDAAGLLLFDPKTQSLQPAASVGFRAEAPPTARIPLSRQGTGRIILEHRALHVADLSRTDEAFGRSREFAAEGFVAYHAVPLVAKGEVKGVLEVFHRTRLETDPEWIDFLETLAGQAAIAVENVTLNEDLRRANAELTLAYDATIEGWSHALDLRDKETEGHSQRVTEMSVRLARAMGVGAEEIVQIRRGALLHDIGKMGIPDRILLKPGALTDEEWQVMRRHPDYAREMLSPIEFLRPALEIPYCHHERWDGGGYPRGLAGEEIPLAARIFTLADIWDALSHDRPYRKAWAPGRVIEYIASLSGTTLDPVVVETFLRLHRAGLVSDLEHSDAGSPLALPDAGPRATAAGSMSDPAPTGAPATGTHRRVPLLRATTGAGEAGGLKVLIAESDRPTSEELWRMVKATGHEPTLAADGRDVLLALGRGGIRVLIVDWALPVIDGPQLCRQIRGEADQRPPYIILTREKNGGRENDLPPGADDFLAKPFDHRELAARLTVARRLLATQEQLFDRSVQAERMYVELRHQNERLAELVATDPLTGLSNRRHLLEVLEAQAALSQRQERPLSLAMLDVDQFKQYNDDYGHRAGDEVLCRIADILRGSVRASDLVARYGGEEFVVVMPMTDESGSLEVAERLRIAICEFTWPLRPITASLGVASMHHDAPNTARLIDAADQALYCSKQRGRNCVTHTLETGSSAEGPRLLRV